MIEWMLQLLVHVPITLIRVVTAAVSKFSRRCLAGHRCWLLSLRWYACSGLAFFFTAL